MNRTNIDYLDYSWNPTHGCDPISTGCKNCWAKTMSKRLAGMGVNGYSKGDPFEVVCSPEKLNEPLNVKKSSRIGVSFMGDLFHGEISEGFIDEVMGVIEKTPQHTYLMLTKRVDKMRYYFHFLEKYGFVDRKYKPFENLWLGVSIENQKTADERIPILLEIPAKVKFVSVEPMLSHVNLVNIPYNSLGALHKMNALIGYGGWRNYNRMEYKLHWIICGSESGPNARPTETEWVRSIRNQCIDAGVPFFLKQLHINGKKVSMPELDGKVWSEMPR